MTPQSMLIFSTSFLSLAGVSLKPMSLAWRKDLAARRWMVKLKEKHSRDSGKRTHVPVTQGPRKLAMAERGKRHIKEEIRLEWVRKVKWLWLQGHNWAPQIKRKKPTFSMMAEMKKRKKGERREGGGKQGGREKESSKAKLNSHLSSGLGCRENVTLLSKLLPWNVYLR